MTALRTINKQLEIKSDDIKQKCKELSYLQDYCTELESKCKIQAKQLQSDNIEKIQIECPKNPKEELVMKY